MNQKDETLARELLEMQTEDLRVREELAATGELFRGYNPQMEAVHLKNARRLEELLNEHGGEWFCKDKIGEAAAEAAWLIVQHAISRPDLQRRMLPILQSAAEQNEIPVWQAAHLEDRIRRFEGKPQIYGTQFDWNELGEMSPGEIFEPENIDQRRRKVGLSVPYREVVQKKQDAAKQSNESPPRDFAKRRREFEDWARKTGWR